MRFCFVTTFYPPYNYGGDGITIQRHARALVRRGHQVTVVYNKDAYRSAHRPPPEPVQPEPEGLAVVPLESGFGTLAPLLTHQTGHPVLYRPGLRRILEGQQFDVIHFHNVSLAGGPVVFKYGQAVKLLTAHDHWLVCPSHSLWRHGRELCTERECFRCQLAHRRPPQWWRYTNVMEREIDHIDTFIALSDFSRAIHRKYGFPREMEVLPCFLPEPTPVSGEAVSARPHDRPYFLFAGRLEKLKGLDDVIPLFREYADADLLIAGQGAQELALRALAQGIHRVKFLGWVKNAELKHYYRHALAALVPSVCYETFGVTVIEAFQQSTPVIARRIGPLPELMDQSEGGLLFTSAAELREALARMQQDSAYRARAAHSARHAFLTRWSEDVVLPQYLEIVSRAAAGHSNGHGS